MDRARPDPPGDHYDVTEGKRRDAIAAGAVELDRDGLAELMQRRRTSWRTQQADPARTSPTALPGAGETCAR